MVINVELVSPLNKQPELNPAGLIDGLEILPAVKSITLVAGLFGAIGKDGVVQPGTASEQSFGWAKEKPEQSIKKAKISLFIFTIVSHNLQKGKVLWCLYHMFLFGCI